MSASGLGASTGLGSPSRELRPGGGPRAGTDRDSAAWIADLRAGGDAREEAIARLHDLLLRAARFEVERRRASFAHLRGDDLDDVALQSADDALVAVLRKLDGFRGQSRFTTWAYKFAILEAGTALRRRAWQGREVPVEAEWWGVVSDRRQSPERDAEARELLALVRAAVEEDLTHHQREVFTALALNGVPIDVLAERLGTTRGALYKTLHDARSKLRARLARAGLATAAEVGS